MQLKKFEEEVPRGRMYQFTRTVSGAVNSFSTRQNSDTCILGEIVDTPFPRSLRDALVHNEEDLSHAHWLMRLAYLRYALKTASDPRAMLEHEGAELRLSPQIKSLLEPFVPKTANQVSVELLLV